MARVISFRSRGTTSGCSRSCARRRSFRGRSGAALTDAGQVLVRHARILQTQMGRAMEEIDLEIENLLSEKGETTQSFSDFPGSDPA